MKILILSNKPPYPPKDGGSIAIYNLAKGLATLGNEVHILAMNTSKHRLKKILQPNIDNLTIQYVDVNTDIKPLALLINLFFSRIPYTASRFYSNQFKETLIELINKTNYDIIQLEGPYLGFYISSIRKITSTPIVIRAHNIEHEIWKRVAIHEKNPILRFYYSNLSKRIIRFERNILSQSDGILPITERDYQAFKNFGITLPMEVAPVAVELINTRRNLTQQRAIMFLGALDWAPNQEGIIWFVEKVWPFVLNKNAYLVFHIAGRNAPLWLQKKLTDTRNVLFHGEVEKSSDFLETADIMVVPILSGSGMRVKIIEAMAYGKVVITTTIGAEGIPVENGKQLIVIDEPQKMAYSIIQLLEHPKSMEEIAKNAFNFVRETFDINNIASKVNNFYNHLVINKKIQ